MGPELVLAIDACVTESTSIVVGIIKKVNEVRKFKSKCLKLGKQAAILLQLLENNKWAIESLQTLQDFKTCLTGINNFVEASKSFNWIDSTAEVFWIHTYRALRKQVVALKEVFIFESIVEVLARENANVKTIDQKQEQLLQGQRSQYTILQELQKAATIKEANQGLPLGSTPLSNNKTDFVLKDPAIITFEGPDASIGRGTLDSIGAIVCYKISLSTSMQANLKIYKDIQAGAYVQRLYGTLKSNGDYYAVMEDLDEKNTLGQACRDKTLPRALLKRIDLAYDLAKSMAWYHRAELLLKSVADDTIVLKKLPSGKIVPFLTRLENARHILEQTTGIVYDTRYEAPEFEKLREHSRFTDVWSLGIAIWQCISSETPYGIDVQVLPEDENDPKIRRFLETKQPPGTLDERWPGSLIEIINQCWDRNPLLRPTAATVADTLLNLRTTIYLANKGGTDTENVLGDDKDRVYRPSVELQNVRREAFQAIKRARELNEKSPLLKESDQKLSKENFRLLEEEEGDDCQAVDAFLVGAIILWNLSDSNKDKTTLALVEVTEEGQRAKLALSYLEAAAQKGYEEAYLEMFKAHAALAREFKARSPKTPDPKKVTSDA